MFTLKDVLLLIVLPFLLSAAGGMATFFLRKRGNWAWLIVLAATLAVLAAGLSQFPPKETPKEAMEWLVLLPITALIAGTLAHFLPDWAALILVTIGGTIATWLLASFLPPGAVPPWQYILLGAAPAILYAILFWPAKNKSAPALPTLFLTLAISTVIVEMAGSFIQFGQYTVALPAALGAIFLLQIIFRPRIPTRALLTAFLLIWTATFTFGHLWADIPPLRTFLLAAAPLTIWIAELLPASLSPFKRTLIAIALALIPLTFAVYPAAQDLLTLLKSQTEVSGY